LFEKGCFTNDDDYDDDDDDDDDYHYHHVGVWTPHFSLAQALSQLFQALATSLLSPSRNRKHGDIRVYIYIYIYI
jgi:hypothetical protein